MRNKKPFLSILKENNVTLKKFKLAIWIKINFKKKNKIINSIRKK